MNHADHVQLLHSGVPAPGGVWADFGAGSGAFTLALAQLIGSDGTIYAIDQDAHALRTLTAAMQAGFPQIKLQTISADFTRPLALPLLDGLVCANALHFQRRPEAVVALLRGYLRPEGRCLIVEYNVERGNFAVPYPIPFTRWETLAAGAGFTHTTLLSTRPSRFLHEIYSAASW
jgi:ubiquinone/menaquinone biosynthesis C-methylase UbiE